MSESESNQKLIAEFRNQFVEEFKNNNAIYYEADTLRISEEEIYCWRYLKAGRYDVNKAFKIAKSSLSWRKEFGVQELEETDINKDLFDPLCLFPFGYDKKGNPNFLILTKYLKGEARYVQDYKNSLALLLDMEYNKQHRNGINVIIDLADTGISKINLSVVKFLLDLISTHYPLLVRSVLVLNMSVIFTALWILVKSLLPKYFVKTIHFVNETTIQEHIDADNLPISMGGNCDDPKGDHTVFVSEIHEQRANMEERIKCLKEDRNSIGQ